MKTFYYDASVLPEITLLGSDDAIYPHKNVRRVSADYIFYFVRRGTLLISENGKNYTLNKGDTFLFEPGLLHDGLEKTEYNLFYVHFKHSHISENPQDFPSSIPIMKQMHFGENTQFWQLCVMFKRIIEQRDRRLAYSSVLTSCELDRFFVEAFRRNPVRQLPVKKRSDEALGIIDEVITYLNNNFQNPISGEQLELALSYNFDYINQLFRRYLDTTVFQMLQTVRMEKACNLLLTDEMSIQHISQEVGFQDEKYFSKVFKKVIGVSPRTYRRESQGLD